MALIKIACDHAGFQRKLHVIQRLKRNNFEVQDLGPHSEERVDYPDFADKLCRDLQPGEQGILVCGSGQGMSMRANKYTHIRAALCWSANLAELSKEHNDANVLCLGARVIDEEVTNSILQKFFNTPFSGGRHEKRVLKISNPI